MFARLPRDELTAAVLALDGSFERLWRGAAKKCLYSDTLAERIIDGKRSARKAHRLEVKSRFPRRVTQDGDVQQGTSGAGRQCVQESMNENSAKPKVLVADDERVIADTLATILNQSGFEARAVYSGEEALELAKVFVPDMLISDVIMADLNGICAAIRIRALLPGIKILLFSGQAATADLLEKARAQGYEFEILAKPVHPQDLLSRLRG
jgi:CheY-like chemotaxis protein